MSLAQVFLMKQLNSSLIFCNMKVYIDKENIRSLLSMGDKFFQNDIYKIFRRQVDTVFNFQKDELFHSDELRAFASVFTEGFNRPDSPVFNDIPFPERPLQNNFHASLNAPQKCSLYLVDDEKTDKCMKNVGPAPEAIIGYDFL